MNYIKRKIYQGLPPITFFIIFISLWEFIVSYFRIPVYLIPPPSMVLITIYNNFYGLLFDTGITLSEAILGFLIGSSVGFLVAVVFAHSRIIEKSIYPYFVALQSVPIIAIAPLLVLWFGTGMLGKIIMAAFICFFPVVVNSTVGLKSVDKESLELMRVLNAKKRHIFFKLRFPSSLPFLFSALKISAVLSVIGAIVAELAGARSGIGFRIIISSYRMETSMMFASIVFAGLCGILFFTIVSLIERKMLAWKHLN